MRRLLIENGWVEVRGGKHPVKMTKPGKRPVTLPMNKGRDYNKWLERAILRQSGLS
jgi:predicted RNA binding protein YcfA (HicA-like mRNA interferase family)